MCVEGELILELIKTSFTQSPCAKWRSSAQEEENRLSTYWCLINKINPASERNLCNIVFCLQEEGRAKSGRSKKVLNLWVVTCGFSRSVRLNCAQSVKMCRSVWGEDLSLSLCVSLCESRRLPEVHQEKEIQFVDYYLEEEGIKSNMNPVKGFPGPRSASIIALALLLLGVAVLNVSGSSLSKSQLDHHHHNHHSNNNNGCEAIHRILNGTNDSAGASGANEGFLMDHEQWHNHRDCK